MDTLTVDAASLALADLGCSAKTIRYQLANAARAGQAIGAKHGPMWLLSAADLSRLREWIIEARAKSGFKSGNQLAKLAKNPGRPKKKTGIQRPKI